MANRRRRQWLDFTIVEDTPSGSQDSNALIRGDIEDTKGMTLIRIVIGLNIIPTTFVGDSVDAQLVTLGIGMMSLEATAAGLFPDPQNETEQPVTGWLWRAQYVAVESPIHPGVRVDLDLRSQRKVMYGQPVLVVSNDPQQGVAFNTTVIGLIRCLYLLE